MRIFVEGPRWSGMWTEISVTTLRQLGHEVAFCYHNRRGWNDRIALLGASLSPCRNRSAAWSRRYQRHLQEQMRGKAWDVLFSIQGRVSADTVRQLRQRSPDLKVVFWWGDILNAVAGTRIAAAGQFADRILLSCRGGLEKLHPVYGERLLYFPFGVSPAFHHVPKLSAREHQRLGAPVSFVGTCYPERCELIRHLNTRLETPVRVWGRGWRHCRGVRGHGALSLADSLRVHAASRISLNLHHRGTHNGLNMKFYEIPAAGGFQVCDWQPLQEESALGRQTVACRSLNEFATIIQYYLEHEEQRRDIAAQTEKTVFATADYSFAFKNLLGSLRTSAGAVLTDPGTDLKFNGG